MVGKYKRKMSFVGEERDNLQNLSGPELLCGTSLDLNCLAGHLAIVIFFLSFPVHPSILEFPPKMKSIKCFASIEIFGLIKSKHFVLISDFLNF